MFFSAESVTTGQVGLVSAAAVSLDPRVEQTGTLATKPGNVSCASTADSYLSGSFGHWFGDDQLGRNRPFADKEMAHHIAFRDPKLLCRKYRVLTRSQFPLLISGN